MAKSFMEATFSFSSPIKEQISIKHLWVNYSGWTQVASYYTRRHHPVIAWGSQRLQRLREGVGKDILKQMSREMDLVSSGYWVEAPWAGIG